jgi:hypothetical protein
MLLATLIGLLTHERTLETRRPWTEANDEPGACLSLRRTAVRSEGVVPLRVRPAAVLSVRRGLQGIRLRPTSFWAANYDDSRLVRLDPGTGRTLASWSTDGGPRDVLLAFGSLWVAKSRGSTVPRLTPP